MYQLSQRSKQKLQGVHPDLVKVIKKAIEITKVDFTVLEGLRSFDQQKNLYEKGATTTMDSRHLTGHAVDIGAYFNGSIRWDWPLYYQLAKTVKQSASDLNIFITWGGDWQSFKDGPHFQLSWDAYPKE